MGIAIQESCADSDATSTASTTAAFHVSKQDLIAWGALGIALAAVYSSAIIWLVHYWWNVNEYSHGFLIPLIAAYLFWIRRHYLSPLQPRPSTLWGGLVLAWSAGLLILGRAGSFALLDSVSLLFALPGLVLLLLGWRYLRALAVPLLYLQFMVPWMQDLVERLRWPFQLLSARVATHLLVLFGFPVLRNESDLVLPHSSMHVAPLCSGIGFLVSIIALGVALVYITQRTWLRAVVVVASVVVITIATNGLRVAMAGVMSEWYGQEMLYGPAHLLQGWFVGQVGVVVLVVLNWCVAKVPSPGIRLFERGPALSRSVAADRSSSLLRASRVVPVLIFLSVLAVYAHVFVYPKPVELKEPVAAFPVRVGEWTGEDSSWIQPKDFFPAADSQLVRTYHNGAFQSIDLYIGYFNYQRQDKSLVNYHDEDLWRNAERLRTGSVPEEVNRSLSVIGGERRVVLFWYQFPSGVVASRYHAKLKQVSDALLYRHNNGTVVVLSCVPRGRRAGDCSNDLLPFAQAIAPVVRQYVP